MVAEDDLGSKRILRKVSEHWVARPYPEKEKTGKERVKVHLEITLFLIFQAVCVSSSYLINIKKLFFLPLNMILRCL